MAALSLARGPPCRSCGWPPLSAPGRRTLSKCAEDADVTTVLGNVLKFGFVLSIGGLFYSYADLIQVGATAGSCKLIDSREPFFQATGLRRVRAFAQTARQCNEVLDEGVLAGVQRHLHAADAEVAKCAAETLRSLSEGACRERVCQMLHATASVDEIPAVCHEDRPRPE